MSAIEEREITAYFSLYLVAKLGPMPDVFVRSHLPTFSLQLRFFSSHLAEFMSRTGLLRQAALASSLEIAENVNLLPASVLMISRLVS